MRTGFGLVALVVVLAFAPSSQSETLMQCMEECIQYEGGNSAANKLTCKNRCGPAAIKKLPGVIKDCMGAFKACNVACGPEKIGQPSACHKKCKRTLRTC